MHHNSVLLDLSGRLFPASEAMGIFAMHHFDMVPLCHQRTSQRLHKYGIPAEMVRRIKRGDHTKAHF